MLLFVLDFLFLYFVTWQRDYHDHSSSVIVLSRRSCSCRGTREKKFSPVSFSTASTVTTKSCRGRGLPLRLPIISSFASHAVLPLLRFVEEHTTLSDSNPDGAGWALTIEKHFHQLFVPAEKHEQMSGRRIATDISLHRSRQTIKRLTKIHRMRTIIDALITSKGEHHRSSNTSRTSDNVSGTKSEANSISHPPNFRQMPEAPVEIGTDGAFTSTKSTLAAPGRSCFNRRIQQRTLSYGNSFNSLYS